MKKIITLFLVAVMLVCVCGCSASDGGNSSEEMQIEYEEIVVDENGNTIVSNDSNTSSDNQTSDNQSTTSNNDFNKDDDDSGNNVIIDYDTVVEVDICEGVLRGYLNAGDPTTQYKFLSEYSTSVLDHQVLPITWQGDGSKSYTVYISENADFSNAYVCTIRGKEFKNGICVPGKTYYWKVLGEFNDRPRGGGKFHVKDAPARFVKIDGVSNVRDMGGWKTESGKTIKYEKIYRGARLDDITDIGIKTIKALGIKTDIDIRSTEAWDSHGAVPKTGLIYHFFDTNQHYDYVLGGGNAEKEIRENYPKMFELLADESNYPIYLHCNFGNDRTGSMAFILNGLLGVNYEDLTRDYEITSYAFAHDNRWRGDGIGGTFGPNDLIQHNISNSDVDGRWGMMNKAFMESHYCTDGKLSTSIENFLLDRGVKQEHINAYKKIMLG